MESTSKSKTLYIQRVTQQLYEQLENIKKKYGALSWRDFLVIVTYELGNDRRSRKEIYEAIKFLQDQKANKQIAHSMEIALRYALGECALSFPSEEVK